MNHSRRRRLTSCKTLAFLLLMLVCWIYWVSVDRNEEMWRRNVKEVIHLRDPHMEILQKSSREARTDLAMSPIRIHKTRDYSRCIIINPKPKPTANSTQAARVTTAPPNSNESPPGEAPHRTGYYPEDLFTLEQRRHGWVLLHISAMIYMFFALAIVFEEFLVPALGVMRGTFHIPEEHAGINFMAAVGFAPEFFTSLIGLFLSSGNVGVGTVVGSGFFNILVVMGTCAMFSDEALSLTWWPLCRDVTFYTFDLFILLLVFLDDIITCWECMLMLLGCLAYVTFIKYDELLEEIITLYLHKHKNIAEVLAIDDPEKLRDDVFKGGSDSLRTCTSRNSIYQLIINTTNPFRDGVIRRKAAVTSGQSDPAEASKHTDEEQHQSTESESSEEDEDEEDEDKSSSDGDDSDDSDISGDDDDDEVGDEDDDEGVTDRSLSLKWPKEKHTQVLYVLLLPITGCLWLTLPDPRKQTSEKYFVRTFVGSLVWIGLFSYFELCLAHRVSETLVVSEEAMCLTVLAAGISAPNIITSVSAAQKGLGGAAVSNSVGINVFDITVVLPVSWLLFAVVSGRSSVPVSSVGLIFIILLLCLTLTSGILCVAAFEWRMNKRFGGIMLMSYFLFLFLSMLLV